MTVDEQIFDYDNILLPHFKSNEYPNDNQKRKICLDTRIPLHVINDWYANQWEKNWINKNPQRKRRMKILNVEPQLLKSFNENPYLNAKNMLNLIIETELEFDEINNWFKALREKINKHYKNCPYPEDETLKHWNSILSVDIGILKNWSNITRYGRIVISEKQRNEMLIGLGKADISEADPLIKSESNKSVVKENKSKLPKYEIKHIYYVGERFMLAKRQHTANRCMQGFNSLAKLLSEANLNEETEVVQGKFTEQESIIMKDTFFNDPYPGSDLILSLSNKFNCDFYPVYTWFARMRTKYGVERKSYYIFESDEPATTIKNSSNETSARQNSFDKLEVSPFTNQGTSMKKQHFQENIPNPLLSQFLSELQGSTRNEKFDEDSSEDDMDVEDYDSIINNYYEKCL